MKHLLLLGLYALLVAGSVYGLSHHIAGVPPLGTLLDPVDGLYYTARNAEPDPSNEVIIEGLKGPVQIVRDERSVPHIFAQTDLDAFQRSVMSLHRIGCLKWISFTGSLPVGWPKSSGPH